MKFMNVQILTRQDNVLADPTPKFCLWSWNHPDSRFKIQDLRFKFMPQLCRLGACESLNTLQSSLISFTQPFEICQWLHLGGSKAE